MRSTGDSVGTASRSMSSFKTRPEGEAQVEFGGHQSPATAGAIWRGAVPHHRRNSPTVQAWLHAGRVMFLGKLGSTAAAAEVLRREHDRGQGVWWKANATHPWRSSDAVPLSSERSDGDSWNREGDVFPPTLSAVGTSLAGGSRCGRRSLGGSATVGIVRTGLRQGSSIRRSNS